MLNQSTLEAIFAYIESYIAEHNYAPNYREIGFMYDLSTSQVKRHLLELRRQGKIDFSYNVARSIHVIEGKYHA